MNRIAQRQLNVLAKCDAANMKTQHTPTHCIVYGYECPDEFAPLLAGILAARQTAEDTLRAVNAELVAACHLADISEHKLLALTHAQLINFVRDVRMTAVSAIERAAIAKAAQP